MATSTSNKGLSLVSDYDFVGKFERDVDRLRGILASADWRKLAPGQVLYTHAVSGTFQDPQTTAGAAVTASTYSDAGTAKALTFNRWKAVTPVEEIAAYGLEEAIARKDASFMKDIQKNITAGIMTGISTGATGTASGTGLQGAAAAGWGVLGTACENEVATPVVIVNHKMAAAWLGSSTILPVNAMGLTVIQNWLGFFTLILDSNVPDNKCWVTAQENMIIATADLSTVAEFGMYMSEDGIIAVSHKADDDHGAIATHAWCGIQAFPAYLDRVIVCTIA